MKQISGIVIRGNQKGREFGFPTANIELAEKIDSGIYHGVARVGNDEYRAAIFIWPDKPILEAYIINFSGDLYDQKIEVELVSKIREVAKFETEAALIEQIRKDVELINKI